MEEFNQKTERKYMNRFGLMYMLGVLVIYALQYGIVFLLGRIAPQIKGNQTMLFAVEMLPLYVLGYPLMMLFISTVPKYKIPQKKMTFGQFLLAFIMCYSLLYVSNLVGTAVTGTIGLLRGRAVDNVLLDIVTNIHPAFVILFAVVLAPVFEELIFRKMLVDRMIRYGEATAVLFSGMMFGLFHGNFNQFVYAFVLGCFFGFLYVKTGRIQYTIILHILVNFMGTVVGILFLRQIPMEELANADTFLAMSEFMIKYMVPLLFYMAYVCLLLALVIAGIVLCIVLRKKFRCSHQGVVTIPKGKRFSTLILNVGMGLFILFWGAMILYRFFQ